MRPLVDEPISLYYWEIPSISPIPKVQRIGDESWLLHKAQDLVISPAYHIAEAFVTS